MSTRQPIYLMLVGLSGSGKTTIRKYISQLFDGFVPIILSSDDIVESIANDRNCTYNEVFSEVIGDAQSKTNRFFTDSLLLGCDIIDDRTNLYSHNRITKLNAVKESPYVYQKLCICCA